VKRINLRTTLTAVSIAGVLFSHNLLAAAEQYKIDPAHSFIQFKISHLGFSTLVGRFNTLEGEFSYDTENPKAASINVVVQTDSLDSNHAERDKHLRGKDFFNVKKYPDARFTSTAFKPTAEGGTLDGELTLMGVTKPITLEVKAEGAGKDPWGGQRRGYTAYTTINRGDFGMDYNLGPQAETVKLELFIEGIRQ